MFQLLVITFCSEHLYMPSEGYEFMNNVVSLDKKRFEKLPAAKFAQAVMSLPAKERMAAILERPDAVTVVRSMSPQDLYVTVMDVGPDDALPLLALASTKQWLHFFDVECWRKDAILPGPGLEWLERLARAGYEPLVNWLYSVEFFFLIALIKKTLRVAVKPDDIDLTEARDYLPPHTIDEVYFWECKYPQYEDLVKSVLSVLFETNISFYQEIMDHAMYALDAEVEEEAYRFHKGRMEDQAIPDYYDAISIYKPIEPSEIKSPKVIDTREIVENAPSYIMVHLGRVDLLKRVVESITDDGFLDYLRLEFASLTNKVIVADQIRIDDSQLREEVLDKVFSTTNLGLYILSSGSVEKAKTILKNVYIEHIFRIGLGPVLRIGRRAKRLVDSGWLSMCPAGKDILENEWYEKLEALLERFPKICRGSESTGTKVEFFQTPADVALAESVLDTIVCIGGLLGILKIKWNDIRAKLWSGGQVLSLEDITISQLLFTAAANFLGDQRSGWLAEPISIGEWPHIFQNLRPDDVEECLRNLIEVNFPNENWKKAVYRYIDPFLENYREEMSLFFERSEVPDPRWVRFFIFKR